MTFFVESLSRRHGALVRRIGEYETVGEAIAAAKTTIDQFLWQALKSGMDAQALFAQYRHAVSIRLFFETTTARSTAGASTTSITQ